MNIRNHVQSRVITICCSRRSASNTTARRAQHRQQHSVSYWRYDSPLPTTSRGICPKCHSKGSNYPPASETLRTFLQPHTLSHSLPLAGPSPPIAAQISAPQGSLAPLAPPLLSVVSVLQLDIRPQEPGAFFELNHHHTLAHVYTRRRPPALKTARASSNWLSLPCQNFTKTCDVTADAQVASTSIRIMK
ncbi:hypothetical protein JMJ77_0015292 [Colletotrichum scovillei]|uniref:Uncharacterized protein n=1 Tax=Colletotrichum scovillei TaxID=1209932 RepID=A0A9P7R1U4_9PEZI|nr:hypothetical protein JMJ77_0015292 [Colletotrichum scovillei]KAG7056912.1 hypothetical protein JMJ78_0000702 [Colletotrichum scovillei]KAG7066841.1 hypothetical protein JMJ76_0000692 [Colletotrichum scovillei]